MEIKVSVAPNRKIKILFLPGSKSALIEMMTLINNLEKSKKIHYRFLLNDELKKICLNQNIASKDNIISVDDNKVEKKYFGSIYLIDTNILRRVLQKIFKPFLLIYIICKHMKWLALYKSTLI